MNSISYKIVLLFTIPIICFSCGKSKKTLNETKVQAIKIKYNNGNQFCEGAHSVYIVGGDTKCRVGIWRFYYPNGVLSDVIEYNNNGEIINSKYYDINGKLENSVIKKDNITIFTRFDENGKINLESTEKFVSETIDGYDVDTTFESVNIYYPNGQIKEQTFYVDGDIEGVKKIWDENGNLLLSVEYKNGFIISNKK